ncbi:MAG: hypothetical protein KH409_01440, partial [Clostridium sp.]|nr:hypothetical protein [Clostridium sp.]
RLAVFLSTLESIICKANFPFLLTYSVNSRLIVSSEIAFENVTFATVTDYLILVVYLLRLLHAPMSKIGNLVSDYEKAVEDLRASVPANVFAQIVHTDNTQKIAALTQKFA